MDEKMTPDPATENVQFTRETIKLPRERTGAAKAKAEQLVGIAGLVPDDELDSLCLVTFAWMRDNGYRLKGTPEEMIALLNEADYGETTQDSSV